MDVTTSFSPETNRVAATPKRAHALDALRGLAILAMLLSGTVPYKDVMPAWMHHAQHLNLKPIGLTWVDLVFPLFIFTLGAAIPLAQSRRIAKGWSYWQLGGAIAKRGALLVAFALFRQHMLPYTINPDLQDYSKWWYALLGFVILFMMFVRLPKTYPQWLHRGVTLTGWAAGLIVLATIQYPHDQKYPAFSLFRIDPIILALAITAVLASVIWLATQNNWRWRLGTLVILFALLLSHPEKGWVTQFMQPSPIPWLFDIGKLKYLFVAIPGTMIGDLLVDWLQPKETPDTDATVTQWSKQTYITTLALLFVLIVVVFSGLLARALPITGILSLGLGVAIYQLFKDPHNTTEMLIHRIYGWGFFWLMLGLAFEAYEGGIKKDPATMSYLTVTTGLSMLLLIMLTIIVTVFQQQRPMQLLIDNGCNPMLAYIGFSNLLWPVIELLRIDPWYMSIVLNPGTPDILRPWLGFIRGFVYTLVIALIVSFFTRRKLIWKS